MDFSTVTSGLPLAEYSVVLFGLATLFGFTGAGSYGDLYVWSFWCLINAVLAVIALVKMKKSVKTA